jgi:hypothetical protein
MINIDLCNCCIVTVIVSLSLSPIRLLAKDNFRTAAGILPIPDKITTLKTNTHFYSYILLMTFGTTPWRRTSGLDFTARGTWFYLRRGQIGSSQCCVILQWCEALTVRKQWQTTGV